MNGTTNGDDSEKPKLPAQKNDAKKKMQIRRLDKIETTALCGSSN